MDTTTKVQPVAVIDHRFGEPGSSCFGYVLFDGEDIRVGYTTGAEPQLWPGGRGIALPGHFQAAADVLVRAGLLVPRDGRVSVRFADWSDSHMIRADFIDADLRTQIWSRRPHGRRA